MTDLNPVDAMTNLSPAARAVLDAGVGYSGPAFEPLVRRMLAAALRAAANQLCEAYTNEEYVDSADDWLDDIAAELEANAQ